MSIGPPPCRSCWLVLSSRRARNHLLNRRVRLELYVSRHLFASRGMAAGCQLGSRSSASKAFKCSTSIGGTSSLTKSPSLHLGRALAVKRAHCSSSPSSRVASALGSSSPVVHTESDPEPSDSASVERGSPLRRGGTSSSQSRCLNFSGRCKSHSDSSGLCPAARSHASRRRRCVGTVPDS
jgi:hypothetical protein